MQAHHSSTRALNCGQRHPGPSGAAECSYAASTPSSSRPAGTAVHHPAGYCCRPDTQTRRRPRFGEPLPRRTLSSGRGDHAPRSRAGSCTRDRGCRQPPFSGCALGLPASTVFRGSRRDPSDQPGRCRSRAKEERLRPPASAAGRGDLRWPLCCLHVTASDVVRPGRHPLSAGPGHWRFPSAPQRSLFNAGGNGRFPRREALQSWPPKGNEGRGSHPREHRLAIQYDGGHHATPAQRRSDIYRDENARGLGWLVLVLTN
jgi:hypothetical protein